MPCRTAYGHLNRPQRFVWVLWVNILTLSPPRVGEKEKVLKEQTKTKITRKKEIEHSMPFNIPRHLYYYMCYVLLNQILHHI